jgi:predicted transcriptional regulator
MEQLWSAGESSVREVMDALNEPPAIERAYTTYMTIMTRLHRKGLLVRRREGKTDHYRPARERDEYIAMQAGAEVEQLVTEYGDLALSSFARQMASLDPARRRRLQRQAREG